MYNAPNTNIQIQTILKQYRNPHLYYRLCTMVATFINKDKYYEFLYYLFKKYKQPDTEIFEKILPFIKPPRDNHVMTAHRHYNKICSLIPNIKVKNYLDFGCGKCNTSVEFGKLLELNPKSIYGTDIKDEFEKNWEASREKVEINFKYSIPESIVPFNIKFDLITAIMVLHHIPPKQLQTTLKAIYNALNPGGYFFIKEHNCENDIDKIFADLTHSLYIIQTASSVDKNAIFAQNIYYKSLDEWNKLMTATGFTEITNSNCTKNEAFASNNRGYFALYKK